MTWFTDALDMLDGYGLVITDQAELNKRIRHLASKDLVPAEAAPDEEDDDTETD